MQLDCPNPGSDSCTIRWESPEDYDPESPDFESFVYHIYLILDLNHECGTRSIVVNDKNSHRPHHDTNRFFANVLLQLPSIPTGCTADKWVASVVVETDLRQGQQVRRGLPRPVNLRGPAALRDRRHAATPPQAGANVREGDSPDETQESATCPAQPRRLGESHAPNQQVQELPGVAGVEYPHRKDDNP